MFSNRITRLFNIDIPIIQAGMVWASGWRLASAVSNAGGLGLIGAGSMTPELLREHIRKCRAATKKPFGVNVPLLHAGIDKQIDVIIEENVALVFTSAGNPATWTQKLQREGIKVVHVISSSRFAKKAEDSGCDAVVAEGFEAGGHNGREETTTFVLTPLVCEAVKIPVIAAGGIATGRQMLAAMVLGAEAVQIGTRFVASEEASSHISFKNAVINAREGDSVLTLKQLTPVRLIKNEFYSKIAEAEHRGAGIDQSKSILGSGRAKQGMFEGNLKEGELEIGQVSAGVKSIAPVADIIAEIYADFSNSLKHPLK